MELRSRRVPRVFAVVPFTVAVMIAAAVTVLGGTEAGAAEATVPLGTAASFAVLANASISNTGATTISGDIGVSPGTAFTDAGATTQVSGTQHLADGVANGASSDATAAYTDASTRPSSASITAPLGGGQVLQSGVYSGGALALNGTLVLDAQGNPDAAFVFQAASSLTTAPASAIALINGADACNVFWQVTSSATLGTNTVFMGTVLANTSVTAQTGAFIRGRLIALTGAVTLDAATVTAPSCAAPGPTTTTTVTAAGPTTTVTAAGPTTTVTAAGPTTTVTAAGPTTTVTAAGPTTTVATATVTIAGPVTTVTVAEATVTAPGPTTTVALSTVPGPTVSVTGPTITAAGPTVTAAGAVVTATVTVPAAAAGTGTDAAAGAGAGGAGGTSGSTGGLVFTGQGLGANTGGLAYTGAPMRILIGAGLAMLMLGSLILWAPRRTPKGAHHR